MTCVQDPVASLEAAGWHALVVAAFVAFAKVNGAIVVGDKAAHAAVLHGSQPLYAAAFICGAFACILPYAHILRRCVPVAERAGTRPYIELSNEVQGPTVRLCVCSHATVL